MNHLAGTYVPDRCSHVLASLAILVNPGPDMQISVCIPCTNPMLGPPYRTSMQCQAGYYGGVSRT